MRCFPGVNPGAIIAKFRGLCKTIDDVRGAFKQFDVDGDGNISRQVFRQKKLITLTLCKAARYCNLHIYESATGYSNTYYLVIENSSYQLDRVTIISFIPRQVIARNSIPGEIYDAIFFEQLVVIPPRQLDLPAILNFILLPYKSKRRKLKFLMLCFC